MAASHCVSYPAALRSLSLFGCQHSASMCQMEPRLCPGHTVPTSQHVSILPGCLPSACLLACLLDCLRACRQQAWGGLVAATLLTGRLAQELRQQQQRGAAARLIAACYKRCLLRRRQQQLVEKVLRVRRVRRCMRLLQLLLCVLEVYIASAYQERLPRALTQSCHSTYSKRQQLAAGTNGKAAASESAGTSSFNAAALHLCCCSCADCWSRMWMACVLQRMLLLRAACWASCKPPAAAAA